MRLSITIIGLLLSSKLFAYEADSLHLRLAMIEKEIFLEEDLRLRNKLLYDKSNLQLENDLPDEAIKSLQRINKTHFNTTEESTYYYNLALAQILAEQFEQATANLYLIKHENDSVKKEVRLLVAFAMNELGNFEESKKILLEDSALYKCSEFHPTVLPVKPSVKDPKKASLLSNLLPGAGQVYTGHPGKAIASFVLTAGFAAFGVYNFVEGYYAMAAFSGLYPAARFYSGSGKLAGKLARRYNEEKVMELKRMYREKIYYLKVCE